MAQKRLVETAYTGAMMLQMLAVHSTHAISSQRSPRRFAPAAAPVLHSSAYTPAAPAPAAPTSRNSKR